MSQVLKAKKTSPHCARNLGFLARILNFVDYFGFLAEILAVILAKKFNIYRGFFDKIKQEIMIDFSGKIFKILVIRVKNYSFLQTSFYTFLHSSYILTKLIHFTEFSNQ